MKLSSVSLNSPLTMIKSLIQHSLPEAPTGVSATSSTSEDKGLEPGPAKDDDPDGVKLLQSADLLERVSKFLQPLATLAGDKLEAWLAIYDVAVRRSQYCRILTRFARIHVIVCCRKISPSCTSSESCSRNKS